MNDFTVGSGNVFADLGLPNPESRLAKANLAMAVSQRIAELGLTQTAAAQLMGLTQPLQSGARPAVRILARAPDGLLECTAISRDDQFATDYHPRHLARGESPASAPAVEARADEGAG